MNQETNRLVLVLLVLNVVMLLFGVCGMAWQASRAAARPSVPTNRAWTPDQPFDLLRSLPSTRFARSGQAGQAGQATSDPRPTQTND